MGGTGLRNTVHTVLRTCTHTHTHTYTPIHTHTHVHTHTKDMHVLRCVMQTYHKCLGQVADVCVRVCMCVCVFRMSISIPRASAVISAGRDVVGGGWAYPCVIKRMRLQCSVQCMCLTSEPQTDRQLDQSLSGRTRARRRGPKCARCGNGGRGAGGGAC